MSLHTNLAQLNAALKDMRIRWEQTVPQWNDAVQREFQEHQWEPLEGEVVAVLKSLDRLAAVLASAKQDIGGHT